MEPLIYDGTYLVWGAKYRYKATSGMKGFQEPRFQCEADKGPVPEGSYHIALILGSSAEDDGTGICRLKPSWVVEEIPRGPDANSCEPYWANWGYNRVRFEPLNQQTKTKCYPFRSGFYFA